MSTVLGWLFDASNAPALGHPSWPSGLLTLNALSRSLIAIGYCLLPAMILWRLRHRQNLMRFWRAGPYGALAWSIGVLCLLSGLSYALDVVAIWHPIDGLQALAMIATFVAMMCVLALLWPTVPAFARTRSARELAEANERLRHEAAAHLSTLRQLETAGRELENGVAERTRELGLIKAAFEAALRGAEVYVFSQDRELRYTWAYSPRGNQAELEMLGHTDEEILPSTERDAVIAVKRRVLETGVAQDCEVSYAMPEGRVLFALHVEPVFGADKAMTGIVSAAVDLTRVRALESEQRRLSGELAAVLQRYEIALRGSNVTAFTQDRALRYTSISSSLFGRGAEEINGRIDTDIIPPESRSAIVALKQRILETGQPEDAEVSVRDNAVVRWYDLHVEPLRDVTGDIIGLTGAAVDVTGRKEGEAQLRLLMRELTHRSKNLLAVIQAMARQTARGALSVDAFLDHFSARLQALATSHDLLVQESWYGASLYDLVRSQIGHHLDTQAAQVSFAGPAVLLRPEAAQNLGLALHELATNAAKYGALSVPKGRISITWREVAVKDGAGVEIKWVETGGPQVEEPQRRGFGTLVIKRNLSRALDADVDLSFPNEGVCCLISIPPMHLTAAR
jgi:PAS domain S-box-containing protein